MLKRLNIPATNFGREFSITHEASKTKKPVEVDGRVEPEILDYVAETRSGRDFQDAVDTTSIRRLCRQLAPLSQNQEPVEREEIERIGRETLGPSWRASKVYDSKGNFRAWFHSPVQAIIVKPERVALTTRTQGEGESQWEHWIGANFDNTGKVDLQSCQEGAAVNILTEGPTVTIL